MPYLKDGERKKERKRGYKGASPTPSTPHRDATDLWRSRAGHSIINHSDPLTALKVSKRPDEQASVSAKPLLTKHTAGDTVRSFPLEPHFQGEIKLRVLSLMNSVSICSVISVYVHYIDRDREKGSPSAGSPSRYAFTRTFL